MTSKATVLFGVLLMIAGAGLAERPNWPDRQQRPARADSVERPVRPGDRSGAEARSMVRGLAPEGGAFFTNATGVSISNVMRSGFDVTFDVTMTTTGPSGTSAFNPGRLGQTSLVTSTGGTTAQVFTTGTTLTFFSGQTNGSAFTQTWHYDYLVATTTQSVPFSWLSATHVTYGNNLPAIDFGDGSTIPWTSLTLSSSATTGGGGMQRVFRGSFSHTYAAPGYYTIQVASPCCPVTYTGGAPNNSPNYGTAVTWNEAPFELTVGTTFNVYFSNFDFYLNRTSFYYNFPLATGSTFGTTSLTYSAGTVNSGFSYHDFTFNTPGYVAAIVATTAANLSVLEVPTASSYGLLVLALLLAAAGMLVLRR